MRIKYILMVAYIMMMVGCNSSNGHSEHDHAHDHETEEHAHDHEHAHERDHDHEHDHDHESSAAEIVLDCAKAEKYGVKTEKVEPAPFSKVIKVSGEILPAQGDSYDVVAPTSGNVRLASGMSLGVAVRAGQRICSITATGMVGGDVNEAAKVTLATAKRELDRLTPLYNDKIVTEREYLAAVDAYEKAKLAYRPQGGNVATTAISGVVAQLNVSDGQYVDAGTSIATVRKNARLLLRADVPERYYNVIPTIKSANIKPTYSESAISLAELNSKVVSSPNASAIQGYIPVMIEFNGSNMVSAGSYVEVYLIGAGRDNALAVAESAIQEELGSKYVFVRLDEECYDKRRVETGESDGNRVEILSGVKAGEEVVTEGAMFVRLAANSSEIPSACNHQH